VLGEPADQAAGGGADRDRAEQGRREQADQEADAAAPAQALAAQVVARLGHGDLATLVFFDEDDAFALDLLALDQLHEPVKVLLGRLDGRVAGHDDVIRVAHGSLLVFSNRCSPAGIGPAGP
jgi:hypothetical protein